MSDLTPADLLAAAAIVAAEADERGMRHWTTLADKLTDEAARLAADRLAYPGARSGWDVVLDYAERVGHLRPERRRTMSDIPREMRHVVDVMPSGDHVAHDLADECVCGPRLDPVKREDGSVGWVRVHHSLDGREEDDDE